MFDIESVTLSLNRHQPSYEPSEVEHMKHAAVSIVLAGGADDLSICFIKRASHPLDPWSGQMALPGGRASAEDPSLRAVAVRETFEEVGLSLRDEHVIGGLSEMQIGRHRRRNLGVLSPFVFYMPGPPAPFVLDAAEVAAAFWIPVTHLWNPASMDTIEYEGTHWPGIGYAGEIIWGLTLRVMQAFGSVIGRPLPDWNPNGIKFD